MGSDVRTSARLFGAAAAATALLGIGSPAFADSYGNDGIHILNGNNASVLPIQACGNNIGVLAIVVPIGSPQFNQCINAPVWSH
ncbi:hypothetical protein [Saccharopolyspora phatthalungensis]|uniref:Chaplin domain-containing protein n=1 Tax=Saccharopolyspora phatthalungensis TaxID=664693 RepID=A0A840Q714_9PSEU|nr:hypothetical protein [Saccharopolyspora phatthalungensis]MBB5155670.1 hypothetical protein [Saccharopolyspora phatthalungensis]